MTAELPLSGVRVLDISQEVGAAYCARLLADMGADVVKVEPVEGDRTRRRGPFPGGVADPECSGLFMWLNLNKRGVTLEPASAPGRERFNALCVTADIVVTSGDAEREGNDDLSCHRLHEAFPHLVVTAVTGFGLFGPHASRRSTEIVAAAASGQLFVQGDRGKPPLKTAGTPFEHAAGVHAAISTLSALWVRDSLGRGQIVDVSVQESAAHFTQMEMTWYTHLGAVQGRIGSRMPFGHPFTILPCADGYVAITHLPQATEMLSVLTGDEAFSSDPRFLAPLDRLRHADAMDERLMAWTMQHTADEIVHLGQELRMALDYVYHVDELLEDEQLRERGVFADVSTPAGTVQVPRAPFGPLGVPVVRPAPRLGQHNDEVFREARVRSGVTEDRHDVAGVA